MKIFNLRISFCDILSQLKLKQKSKGVTLLELSVVLLIIGIVISGAYVAYDFFIKRAKTTKTMIEMKDYRKGFESFHSVYGALPGDMTSASRRIDSTMIDGNGDGKIASETEQNAFWPHMSYSKMISKPSGGKYENTATNVSPKVGVNLPRLQDSDDIAIGVIYNTPSGVRANSFILGGLDGRSVTMPRFSVEEAQIMDQKFDDNNPTTGGVMCGMGVQSGTITACSYSNASVQSDANIFIPFTPQTTDASNSCPAQSVQISQQLVANAPVIAANATVQYNCRDINPSYSGTYSLTCNPVKDSASNVIGYSISTASTSCSLKTCAVPTLSSISGAASIQSTAVQSGQYLSYTCNAGLYATKSLCSPNLSTDAASFNPAPACTASPTGVAGNIPEYASDAQTFKDSGRKFNDYGSTVYDVFSGNKIFGLFGSTSTSQNYIPKYNTQNAGVVPSSIYDNGTSVGIGTSTPNSSAILDLSSTTKAFLPPRMTTIQMNAIAAPAKGMIIFNTTDNVLYQYSGTTWGAVNAVVPVAGATPVGTIVAWGSNTIPNGWVLLDGQTTATSSYLPELCQVLNGGTACASGVTKTVPDFRGYFLRGLDTTLTTDKNNAAGSLTTGTARTLLSTQTDDNKAHAHWISGALKDDGNFSGTGGNTQDWGLYADSGSYVSVDPNRSYGRYNLAAGGVETRPVNIAVNYIMKAQSTNLTTQDVNNILSTMMSAVTNSTANSLVMFDATASKFSSTNVYQRTTSGVTSVGVGTSSPAQSAVLELYSKTQGFLPPRMTITEMNAIASPVTGMIVYTTDNSALQMWNGSGWAIVTSPSTGPTASTVPTGTIVAWGSNTIPNGWLLLNGGTYSSQTYPDLANALGCGTSTCTLPNYQGYFLRGYGGASGALGTIQGQTTARPSNPFVTSNPGDHIHSSNADGGSYGIMRKSTGGGSETATNFDASSGEPDIRNAPQALSINYAGNHTHTIEGGGDSETRPANIAVNYIIKAKNVTINQSDLTSITSNLLTTGTTGTPNALSMFDSTGVKFQSSGLSQVSGVLTYNPTDSTNLMSLSSTGMLLKPTSGIALQVGDTGTGIANINMTGSAGLSDTLDFYVNGAKKMSIDANGTLTLTSISLSTFSPNSISVGAGGLTTTTLSASGTSTLAGLLTANGGISTAGLTASALTLNGSGTITGNLSVTGTSTLTGLLTANSGIKVGSTTIIDSSGNITLPTGSNITSSGNTVRTAKPIQFTPVATSLSGISSALYIGDNGSSLYFNDSSGNPNKLLTTSASVVECTLSNLTGGQAAVTTSSGYTAGCVAASGAVAPTTNMTNLTAQPVVTTNGGWALGDVATYWFAVTFSTNLSNFDATKSTIAVMLDGSPGANYSCSANTSSATTFMAMCTNNVYGTQNTSGTSTLNHKLRVVITPYK